MSIYLSISLCPLKQIQGSHDRADRRAKLRGHCGACGAEELGATEEGLPELWVPKRGHPGQGPGSKGGETS
jgi:hypothetical protein